MNVCADTHRNVSGCSIIHCYINGFAFPISDICCIRLNWSVQFVYFKHSLVEGILEEFIFDIYDAYRPVTRFKVTEFICNIYKTMIILEVVCLVFTVDVQYYGSVTVGCHICDYHMAIIGISDTYVDESRTQIDDYDGIVSA